MAGPNPERVRIDYDEHVATVWLTRARKHNALDWEMFASLNAALDELAGRPGLRAVVLAGEGPSFCSGLDFPSFLGGEVDVEALFARRDGERANEAQRIVYGWQRLEVPVIAAVHGNCLGGGAQLALGADIRIAGPDLRFSVMEIRYGLIPDMGITQSLPTLTGLDVAKELTFTGRIVEAEEALRLGLVTRLAPDPVAAAHELAREIAGRSPDAIRRAKRLWNEAAAGRDERMLALEAELQHELLGTPNQIAAVQAALTGEPARFRDPA